MMTITSDDVRIETEDMFLRSTTRHWVVEPYNWKLLLGSRWDPSLYVGTDDPFDSLDEAIEYGRQLFDCLCKAVEEARAYRTDAVFDGSSCTTHDIQPHVVSDTHAMVEAEFCFDQKMSYWIGAGYEKMSRAQWESGYIWVGEERK